MLSHCRPGSREDQNHGFAESSSGLHFGEMYPEWDPPWEGLVTMLPNGLVYHHPAWLLAFLLQAVVERVSEEPRACLQLKLFSNPLDGLVEGVVGIPWSTTYRLELPGQPEHLRFGNSRNHSRIRWAINKATRLGVEVRPAETERELRAWYELYLHTMRRFAVPPRPYRFFEVAWVRLQHLGLVRLLLATPHEAGRGSLLAGSLFLRFAHTS